MQQRIIIIIKAAAAAAVTAIAAALAKIPAGVLLHPTAGALWHGCSASQPAGGHSSPFAFS